MSTETELTIESLQLFVSVVKDLPNWSKLTPCFNHITKKNRGNLTDLKRKKLLTTWKDEGEEWIELTAKGKEHAKAIGLGEYVD